MPWHGLQSSSNGFVGPQSLPKGSVGPCHGMACIFHQMVSWVHIIIKGIRRATPWRGLQSSSNGFVCPQSLPKGSVGPRHGVACNHHQMVSWVHNHHQMVSWVHNHHQMVSWVHNHHQMVSWVHNHHQMVSWVHNHHQRVSWVHNHCQRDP